MSFTSLSGSGALPVKSLFAQAAEQKESASGEVKTTEVNSNYEGTCLISLISANHSNQLLLVKKTKIL